MEEAQAVTEVIRNLSVVAGSLTVTGLLLWFVVMFLTGRILRREELEAERKRSAEDLTKERERTAAERQDGLFWRGRYLEVFGTAQESITALRQTTEATRDGMTALRVTVEAAMRNRG